MAYRQTNIFSRKFQIGRKAAKTRILDYRKIDQNHINQFNRALGKTNGAVDVWVHPFFIEGEINRLIRKYKGGITLGQHLEHEEKLHMLEQNIPAYKEEAAKARMKIQKGLKNKKPLLVFVARSEVAAMKELFEGFKLNRLVLFIPTEGRHAYPAVLDKNREGVKRRAGVEFGARQDMLRQLNLHESSKRIIKEYSASPEKITRKFLGEHARLEEKPKLVEFLKKLNIEKANIFGEVAGGGEDKRCVEVVNDIFQRAEKFTRIKSEKTFDKRRANKVM